MSPARKTVMGGSAIVLLARLLSMVGGFTLFLLLTWRSREAAGLFRTVITFFVMMDMLPLLGMHRWLAAELAHEPERQAETFRMALVFATTIATISGVIYLAIAASGLYQPAVSASLDMVALSTVPSAINLCVITALVGLGYSHLSGVMGLVETLARTLVAMALMLAGAPVIWVVVVFTASRFLVAAVGLGLTWRLLGPARWGWNRTRFAAFLRQVPNLALSMVGFMTIRSTGILLLPWFHGEGEAGLYAAPFQLFDLLLLFPTVLTITTNFIFVASARRSTSRLRRTMNDLLAVTCMFVFPLAVMACILARPMILFLFGDAYTAAVPPFQLLMGAAVLASLDQALSTAMVNARCYRADRLCTGVGALATLAVSLAVMKQLGASGAALGLLAGMGGTFGLRLRLMGPLFNLASFGRILIRQVPPTLLAGLVASGTLVALEAAGHEARIVSVALPSITGTASVWLFYACGGLGARQYVRLKSFFGQRN